jgi:hypothetical protein
MPYQPKAERERPLWMTLVEAVEHVQAHLAQHGYMGRAALRELRMACGEGEIPLHWAADQPPEGIIRVGLPPLFSDDVVPTDPLFWENALIFLIGSGRVVDQRFIFIDEADTALERAPRPRELFLLRSRVLELWPLRSDTQEEDTPTGESGSADQIPTRRQSPATDEEILAVARDLYRQAGNNPPNQTKAEQLVAALLLGTKRDFIRPILRRPEFGKLRRKPGRQPWHRKPSGEPAP